MSKENVFLMRDYTADMARQLNNRIEALYVLDEYTDEPGRAKANKETLRQIKRVEKLLLKALEIV